MGKRLKEYSDEPKQVADFLPWEAIGPEGVILCKDESLIGVIEYFPTSDRIASREEEPLFRQGWSLWTEKQHSPVRERYFVILSWNPFYDKNGNIINSLGNKEVDEELAEKYFAYELSMLQKYIHGLARTRKLDYKEIAGFLLFATSFREETGVLPEVPIDLDFIITQETEYKFLNNSLLINGQSTVVVSFPGFPGPEDVNILYDIFSTEIYRHVRRILAMDSEEYKENFSSYCGTWCKGRKAIKNEIIGDITGSVFGYMSECFVFLMPSDRVELFTQYLTECMMHLGFPYILETYNSKDVWWGSLPGLFRANINPPPSAIGSIADMIWLSGGDADVQA